MTNRERELQDKITDLQMYLRMSRDCSEELRAENANLRAANEAMREALKLIAERADDERGNAWELAEIATAALTGREG